MAISVSRRSSRQPVAREPFANVLERSAPSTMPRARQGCRAAAWAARRARRMLRGSTVKGAIMLWTIVFILLALWAVGLVTSTTMGGLIHFLLVAAIIVVLIRLIQGRRVA